MRTLLKNEFLLIIASAFMLVSIGKAQVNGYLGNRYSAGYHLGIGTDFKEFFGGSEANCRGSILNYRHDLVFNYVFARRSIVGAEIGYSTMDFTNLTETVRVHPDEDRDINTRYKANISYLSYGINAKFYGGGSTIAPIGYYFKMRTGLLNGSVSLPSYMYHTYPDNKATTVAAENKSFSAFYFGLGGGNTRIFAGKVVLDISIEFNWVNPGTFIVPIFYENQSLYNNPEYSALTRIAHASFVNYTIGMEGLFGKKSKKI